MTCSLCPKTALYVSGKKPFCKDHYADAQAEMVKVGKGKVGAGPTFFAKHPGLFAEDSEAVKRGRADWGDKVHPGSDWRRRV